MKVSVGSHQSEKTDLVSLSSINTIGSSSTASPIGLVPPTEEDQFVPWVSPKTRCNSEIKSDLLPDTRLNEIVEHSFTEAQDRLQCVNISLEVAALTIELAFLECVTSDYFNNNTISEQVDYPPHDYYLNILMANYLNFTSALTAKLTKYADPEIKNFLKLTFVILSAHPRLDLSESYQRVCSAPYAYTKKMLPSFFWMLEAIIQKHNQALKRTDFYEEIEPLIEAIASN